MHPVPSPMTRPSTKPDDLGTSHIPPSDSFVGKLDFGASLRFSFVTTCRFARPPVGADQVFTQPTRTFTSGLPTDWSPAPPPDITTVATGQVPLTGLSPARTPTSIAATGLRACLPPRSFPPLQIPLQGGRGFYVRAERASLPPHAPDMLSVRIQAIDRKRTSTFLDLQPCRPLRVPH
jgi:hypothetical protein